MARGRRLGARLATAALTLAAALVAAAPALAGPALEVSEVEPQAFLGSIDRQLIFAAGDGGPGVELWSSDGTDSGTEPLAGIGTQVPVAGVEVSDRIVFMADDGVHGLEPWVTDGTGGGTQILADVNPGPAGQPWYAGEPVSIGEQVLFAGNDGAHGLEWWRTDGTPEGTELVADANPGAGSILAGNDFDTDRTAALGMVFFTSSLGGQEQLWRTDGTEQGTVPLDATMSVRTLRGGAHGGHFYFTGAGYEVDDEIWRSDGTPEGTAHLVSPDRGGEALSARSFSSAAGRLYFYANEGVNDQALWVSDGTAAGTRMLLTVTEDASQPEPELVQEFDGQAIFPRFQPRAPGQIDSAPWITDGTAAGTRPVRGLPEDIPTALTHLDIVDDTAIFDAGYGADPHLWSVQGADGTAAPVETLGPARELFAAGTQGVLGNAVVADVLYFSGITRLSDGSTDTSLWKMDIGDTEIDGGPYVPSRQPARARRNVVRAKVRAGENIRVVARGQVRLGDRWRKLRGHVRSVAEAERGKLKLATRRRRDWGWIERRLDAGRRVDAWVRVVTTDQAGNRERQRKRVRLR